MALRVESNNENVAIRNKTNTWYFENIAPQEKITVKVSAQINLGVEGEFVDFNYTEQYDDKDGEQKEETGTIAVTLTRLPKIQWEITALNDVVYAGDRIALSGNIMNVGQGKAYNVNVTMEVPGLHLEKRCSQEKWRKELRRKSMVRYLWMENRTKKNMEIQKGILLLPIQMRQEKNTRILLELSQKYSRL